MTTNQFQQSLPDELSMNKVLFKKTSIGQTQLWCQEISGDGTSFRTVTGKLNGKLVYSAWTQCLPKNVGRSNATTAEQQCQLEVEANYKKKLAQGNYKDSLDEEGLKKDNYFKPMLAKKFGEDYTPTVDDYMSGIIRSQAKLDGVRCIVNKDGMWSRQGKPIVSAPHIFDSLVHLFEGDPDLVFDGELYADKLSNDFNKIISLVRQTKPTQQDLEESKKMIQYHVYDFPSFKEDRFSVRYLMLKSVVNDVNSEYLVLVPATVVIDKEHLNELYAEYMAQGYEGQMVRISDKGYECKRSKQLLKRKEFLDQEFEILDIQEGIGNRSGIAGNVICKADNGKPFGAGINGSWKFAEELLQNRSQYIGTLATIKYQHLTAEEQIPRFGIAVVFHGTKKREI